MSLTISAEHSVPRASVRRARLADDLVRELTSWAPRERMGAFRRWQHSTLSLVHLSVLTVLEAEGPLSMGRVAEALDVSVASATGIVARMAARGVVERRHHANDRRLVMVHLTPRGTKVFQNLEEHHRKRLATLLEQLSEDEMEGFLVGLRALRSARSRSEAQGSSDSQRPSGAPAGNAP